MPDKHLTTRLAQLDPERDHQEMVYLLSAFIFPWDIERALEFALFRTYGVPSISGLLAHTGELTQRPRKRYDDTELLMCEMMEHGYDSERGRRALRRINQMHGRFSISNDDMRYVLSTFMFEPIRWLDKYGWRPLTPAEKQAWFRFYWEVGRRMNIQDLPADYAAYEQFNRAYEQQHFQAAASNHEVAARTTELFLGFYLPRPLWFLGRPFLYAAIDAPLLQAMGLPHPPDFLRGLVRGALRLRAGVVGQLPERTKPVLATAWRRPTYPEGYEIEGLGTFGKPGSEGKDGK